MTGGRRSARPVFVLGSGRCGSTLVHELVARHPGAGFLTNLDDLGLARSRRWHNEAWRRLPPGVTRKGRARFAPTEGYRLLAREVGPVVVDPVRDLTARDASPWLRRRFRDLWADRARALGAPVLLHKLTGWPRVGFLDACFPDALFVEVVRDGRAVAGSWTQMPWWRGHRGTEEWHFGPLDPHLQRAWSAHEQSFPVLAGLGWRMLMDAFDRAREQVPADRWLQVRYEDVVADPVPRLREVLDHVGLPMTEPFARAVLAQGVTGGRTDAFREDLAPQDVAALDDVLADQLVRHGYR